MHFPFESFKKPSIIASLPNRSPESSLKKNDIPVGKPTAFYMICICLYNIHMCDCLCHIQGSSHNKPVISDGLSIHEASTRCFMWSIQTGTDNWYLLLTRTIQM